MAKTPTETRYLIKANRILGLVQREIRQVKNVYPRETGGNAINQDWTLLNCDWIVGLYGRIKAEF